MSIADNGIVNPYYEKRPRKSLSQREETKALGKSPLPYQSRSRDLLLAATVPNGCRKTLRRNRRAVDGSSGAT